MTIEEQITYWTRAADHAATKELALVAFGISAGLRMAKDMSSTEAPRKKTR